MEIEELLELEKTKKLTSKQEMFCQEYILCLNQTKAYMKAYPNSTEEAARRSASRLMTNADINARIDQLRKEIDEKYKVNAGMLIQISMDVISKALEGKKEKVFVDGQGLVDTGEIQRDYRAVNDAVKNIASITGLNVQKLQASVDADVKTTLSAKDVARAIMADDT